MPDPDLLETAVRAFTLRKEKPKTPEEVAKAQAQDANRMSDGEVRRKRRWRARWREALVWDTETVTTPDQRLLVLCWRLYVTDGDLPPVCIEEGLAYPDDLATWDPTGIRELQDFASQTEWAAAPGYSRQTGGRTIRCETLSWWLEHRMFRHGYVQRDRCDIVGFNLLFDLGRIASYWAPAQDEFFGGWSLCIWGSYNAAGDWKDELRRPRLRAKAIDPRRTLFAWGGIGADPLWWRGRGRFVDLRTLAFALTDRGHSLESACDAFGIAFDKAKVDHGTITPHLLRYARKDVEATADLYFACLGELARHEGVDLQPHNLYSPATIGSRYLEAMGYERPLGKFTLLSDEQLGWRETKYRTPQASPLDPTLLGWSMSAFYGGRAEARIVRTPVPIALVDYTSMHPSVNALLDTRSLLSAASIRVDDVTPQVRALLAADELEERCLAPAFWRDDIGVTLVQLQPRGDILPVRARYDSDSGDHGIGVNPYWLDGPAWYSLPDVIAAAVLGDQAPKIIRAARLIGVGQQAGLRPVKLRGDRELDPTAEVDPFIAIIEGRHRVLQDTTLSESEKERRERFLKVTANSTSYGVLARFDRRERATRTDVTVYGPDGTPQEESVPAPEDPGPFSFPPIAATITAAARLMLALLEKAVTRAGGSYAFCDTDSLAIVATPEERQVACPTPDGTGRVTALSWASVREILDRFTHLNLFDPRLVPGSPWSVKHNSLKQELGCYAISAKRYALYRLDPQGQPVLLRVSDSSDDVPPEETADLDRDDLSDWSEHGLGLYLDPTLTDPDDTGRDKKGRRIWARTAWTWILRDALDSQPELPTWAHRYALTRFTLSGPGTAAWFDGYNATRPRSTQIRPGSFGLIAHPEGGFTTGGALPTAPYERNPADWPGLTWYDRATANPIGVTTVKISPDQLAFALAKRRRADPSHRERPAPLPATPGTQEPRPRRHGRQPEQPRPAQAPTNRIDADPARPHRQRGQQTHRTPHRRDPRSERLPQRLRLAR
jgi:hypothetical protein